MLTSLEVRRFRAFEQFSLLGLTRVNLLIGGNNAGKTTLMEAAELLLGRGAPWILTRSPVRRGDGLLLGPSASGPANRSLVSIRYLFHGYQLRPGSSFKISGTGRPDQELSVVLKPSEGAEPGQRQLEPREGLELEETIALELVATDASGGSVIRVPLRPGGQIVDRYFRERGDDDGPPVNFVDTRDPETRLGMMWDQVVLTPKEADVVQALQLVDPGIERIAQLSSQWTSRAQMVVKRIGSDEPVPIGTMGDGAKRLLVLSVNLATAARGYLLVDEIDTGLHHSVLSQMWRLVLATAKRLDIQVFASTHSLDGLRSLASALAKDAAYRDDVSVHRIVQGETRAVRYSAHELELAVAEDMEIR